MLWAIHSLKVTKQPLGKVPSKTGSSELFSFLCPGHWEHTVLFSKPQQEQENNTGDLHSQSSYFHKTGELAWVWMCLYTHSYC